MSTSETWSTPVADCPCNAGKIIRHVTTQDNPWSSADISHTVDCPQCVTDWRADNNGWLTNLADEQIAAAAMAHWDKVEQPLLQFAHQLASTYFVSFGAPNKKAELAELDRLGIGGMSYRNYLDARRQGKSPGQICHPLNNRKWLRGLAAAVGKLTKLEEMLAEHDSAEAQWRAAREAIRQIKFGN